MSTFKLLDLFLFDSISVSIFKIMNEYKEIDSSVSSKFFLDVNYKYPLINSILFYGGVIKQQLCNLVEFGTYIGQDHLLFVRSVMQLGFRTAGC